MEPGDIRAGDVDRERVADHLRKALEEGRLTLSEFDDRLKETYAAKTYRQLEAITDDLPGPVPAERSSLARRTEARPAEARPAAKGQHGAGWPVQAWRAWFAVVMINVIIWAAVSLGNWELIYFWPMWVAGPWGVVLLMATIAHARGRPDQHR